MQWGGKEHRPKITINLNFCNPLHPRADRPKVNIPAATSTVGVESGAEKPVKPKKRALLIGIQYKKPDLLRGSHRDVEVMKRLLLEKYGYQPQDIVTLVDSRERKQKKPTCDNIMEEMKNLVKDAAPGDRFFFHYSGHSMQLPNEDKKEEDGFDEYIVPCDAKLEEGPKLIKDDVLKKILVDGLPKDSHLVAIFDSCHSASLLDLKHFRCNRVYVPWVSKGRRRSDSKWYANVRKDAALRPESIRQRSRMSDNLVKISPNHTSQHIEFVQPSVQPPMMTARGVSPTERRRSGSLTARARKSGATAPSSWLEGDCMPLVYDSPVNDFCTGECRWLPSPVDGRKATFGSGKSPMSLSRKTVDALADVISLGAAKDSQVAWEDMNGNSMTQSLVEILSKDPHPTIQDFMTTLNHTLHDRLMKMHQVNMDFKKRRKWWRITKGKKAPPEGDTNGALEFNNFQDPQISSQRPLDMSSHLEL